MNCEEPIGPIPDSLRGIEMGTFTYDSIVQRLPDIGRRMLGENNFLAPVKRKIETLLEEIPNAQIRPIDDPDAPDASDWASYVAPYLNQNWLEVPWFFSEAYFYRRALEATGFFREGPGYGADPFLYQKRQGLKTSDPAIHRLSEQFASLMNSALSPEEGLGLLLAIDLWGNQVDLSLWPADGDDKPDHQDASQQKAHTLVDDTRAIAHHLLERPTQAQRVDLILDNAGFELVADLFLAAYLVAQKLTERVMLHTKPHPTFVSDAMIKDVRQTISSLEMNQQPETAAAARRLSAYLSDGRLALQTHWFWTSPLDMWLMPIDLRQELGQADLVISKGDANYRRLLGDRHWPFTTPISDILCYMPAPVAALRTLKSEIAVGLSPDQPEALAAQDPAWLYDGKWGVIQFANPDDFDS